MLSFRCPPLLFGGTFPGEVKGGLNGALSPEILAAWREKLPKAIHHQILPQLSNQNFSIVDTLWYGCSLFFSQIFRQKEIHEGSEFISV